MQWSPYTKLLRLISCKQRIVTEYYINTIQIWLTHSVLVLCHFERGLGPLTNPSQASQNSTGFRDNMEFYWQFHWEFGKVLHIWQHQETNEKKMPIWCLYSSQRASFLISFKVKPYFTQICSLLIRNLALYSFTCPNHSPILQWTEPTPYRKQLIDYLLFSPKYAPCGPHASLMSASFQEIQVCLPQRPKSFWRRFWC